MMTVALASYAQYYTTGDDPSSIRWRQINTQQFRIIHAKEMSPWAMRLSTMMDSIMGGDSWSMHHSPGKIDILLHSQTTFSNGMVVWAPSRLEMYTYGQADGDCVPWMTHLAVHEYRHVVQTSMLKRGFTRFLYGLFGEQAVGAVLGAYVPLWFVEGDAVANETSLTQGGRGRQAMFEQEMRALALSGTTPQYDQAYNGSYRRRVPNYYHMGYLTVSDVRRSHGAHVWREALETVGSKSFSFTPFNRTLKRHTGMDKVQLYNQAMENWSALWSSQDSTVSPTPFTNLLTPHDDFSEFTSAQMTSNGVVALKSDPDELTQIVDKNGRRITTPAVLSDNRLSTHGDTIVWCERHQHPRWENGGYNTITMCTADGKRKRHIAKGMFSCPVISPDGSYIAVSETKADGNQNITVIDFNGNITKTYPLDDYEQATSLCWTDNGIAFISLTDKGKAIYSLSPEGSRSAIRPPSFTNIRHITADRENIYFTSDATGIENIYFINAEGKETRITSSRIGAAWPMVCNDTLFYSEYSSKGYSVVSTPLSTRASDNPISPMRDMADLLSSQEGFINTNTDTTKYDTYKYRRISHLFRFHSWGPIVVNSSSNTVSAGIAVASQNTLGSSSLSAGINWSSDTEERYFARYCYSGLFPKFDLYASWGYYDHLFDGIKITSDEKDAAHNKYEGIRISYDDRQRIQHYAIRTYIPLNFNSGAWSYGILPRVSADYNKRSSITVQRQHVVVNNGIPQTATTDMFLTGQSDYTTLGYELGLSATQRMAARDVGCRLGISASAGYWHCPSKQNNGSVRYGNVTIFLPGLAQHHNISLQAQYQDKEYGDIQTTTTGDEYHLLLNDAIDIARGTKRERNKSMALLRANYTMPIIDPDFSLGSLCYIKRIVGRLFYDRERIELAPYTFENNTIKKTYNSVGIETWMESHWLRLPYMIKLGYRGSLVNSNNICNELILGINIK